MTTLNSRNPLLWLGLLLLAWLVLGAQVMQPKTASGPFYAASEHRLGVTRWEAAPRLALSAWTTDFASGDTVAAKGTTTFPEGISFRIDQPKHLATVDSFTQKGGVSGGHNAEMFYDVAKEKGIKFEEFPTGVKGIIHVEYKVPAKDASGNFTGSYKGNGSKPFEKTIYDPKVFTDQKMLELGQQAAANGYKAAMAAPGGITNVTVGGVGFRIYVDKVTGVVRNFHPN